MTSSRPDPILVLAGHFPAAEQWAMDRGLNRGDWRYIRRPSDLNGRQNCRIGYGRDWDSNGNYGIELLDVLRRLEAVGQLEMVE